MGLLALVALVSFSGCGVNEPTAQEVLKKAIERHGFEPGQEFEVQFDFRNNHYNARISEKGDVYKRVLRKGNDVIEDIITHETYSRRVNHEEIDLRNDNLWYSYSADTRSVIYFALLPYGLNKEAMNIQLMPCIELEGQPYFKVEIIYGKNGGGKDFEDVFVYWVHQTNYTIDYLAYSFNINGGGVRFRKAYNQREVDGIRFQDYVNYTIDKDYPAHELDYAYQTNQLREISRINLENIKVAR